MPQDFEGDPELRAGVKDLLEEMVVSSALNPTEHKAAASILRVLTKEEEVIKTKIDLHLLLTPPSVSATFTILFFATCKNCSHLSTARMRFELLCNFCHHILYIQTSTNDNFDTLSALDIAEQLTYLDHQIFMAIRSE